MKPLLTLVFCGFVLPCVGWVADGVDPSFDHGGAIRSSVQALALDNQGRVYLSTLNEFLRLLPNGRVDTTFRTNRIAGGAVLSMEVQPDGKVLAGGIINTVGTNRVKNLVRLNLDGSVDESFKPTVNGSVYKILVQPELEKIVIVGGFDTVNAEPRLRLARLNMDGGVDAAFQPSAITNGQAYGIAQEASGSCIVVGNYATSNFGPTKVARFDADGNIDPLYAPVVDAQVISVVRASDGGCVIVGGFSQINGISRSQIAKLKPDGSLDLAFQATNAILTGFATRVVQGPNGLLVTDGEFKQSNVSRAVTAFRPDGTLSYGYDIVATSAVTILDMVIQGDGRVLIGGEFRLDTLGSSTRRYLARLNRDALIRSFTQGTNLVLYWPLSYTGFSLEQSTNAAGIGSWMPVERPPALVSTVYAWTNSMSATKTFYRLKH